MSNKRININGVYRDMTPQEIAELEANKPVEQPQPTKEELMAKLAEIQEQLAKL